jgi:hypothetical protein
LISLHSFIWPKIHCLLRNNMLYSTVLQHYTSCASTRYRWLLYGGVSRHTYIAIQTFPRNLHLSTPPHFYVSVIDQWLPKYAPHGIREYISLTATHHHHHHHNHHHHHHHVPEGLGILACSLILKIKLVPSSLPRSSYVSSSVWFIL